MELDHVLVAAADLDEAAAWFADEHGLVSRAGGRHPGWGTANRIIALGESYLELVTVAEPEVALRTAFGAWVSACTTSMPTPIGWAVRTTDLDAVASRIGIAPTDGSRRAPDGRLITWRLAGVERAAEEPCLPFFIEWGGGTPFPGADPADPGLHLVSLRLSGDARRLQEWLGGHALPVSITDGPPGVAAVVVSGPRGEIMLRGAGDR